MKCIVCDRCKTIIENPRRCRVITCARPLKPRTTCEKGKVTYHGNDPQQNDILWEKEVCDNCLDELEAFFEVGGNVDPHPPEPVEPDPDVPEDPDPDVSTDPEDPDNGEKPSESGNGDGGGVNPEEGETGAGEVQP